MPQGAHWEEELICVLRLLLFLLLVLWLGKELGGIEEVWESAELEHWGVGGAKVGILGKGVCVLHFDRLPEASGGLGPTVSHASDQQVMIMLIPFSILQGWLFLGCGCVCLSLPLSDASPYQLGWNA